MWDVTESSRLTTTADALTMALGTLADALAGARPDEVATSEAALATRTLAFQAAVADAVASGEPVTPYMVPAMSAALRRCRRLGHSLSLLARPAPPVPEALQGYTPVGHPLSSADGGSFLTARG